MNISDILSKVDHTLLAVDASWEDIRKICDDGIKYHTASVCIPPCYVAQAHDYCLGKINICTVIGFPNGYMTTAAKAFEAADAAANGADEIDMVINIGKLKSGEFKYVSDEISTVRASCSGKILKVIIETCLLDDEQIKKMCEIVSDSGADYIKTSTGFSKGVATLHAVEIMKKNVSGGLKIKAAGGISSITDAEAFVNAGADRLGTSRIVKIVKEKELC